MKQEQEIAKNIAVILDREVSLLEKETTDLLAAARNKAVEAMPLQAQTEPVFAGVSRLFDHLHGQRFWLLMTGMLGALLMAVILLQSPQNKEPMDADALLLGSDLPPEAYLDKGFDAWLEQSSRH